MRIEFWAHIYFHVWEGGLTWSILWDCWVRTTFKTTNNTILLIIFLLLLERKGVIGLLLQMIDNILTFILSVINILSLWLSSDLIMRLLRWAHWIRLYNFWYHFLYWSLIWILLFHMIFMNFFKLNFQILLKVFTFLLYLFKLWVKLTCLWCFYFSFCNTIRYAIVCFWCIRTLINSFQYRMLSPDFSFCITDLTLCIISFDIIEITVKPGSKFRWRLNFRIFIRSKWVNNRGHVS